MGKKKMFVDDQEMCSTPKLPLFSFPINRATDTPGLATPPVNVAGTVPFLWEEAPGKPRPCCSKGPKPNGVVRCLELPPRLLLPGEGGKSASEPSPTTVLDGPYVVCRRSLSLPRSASLGKGRPSVKERGFFGSTRWGGLRKSKEAVEGKFDFSRLMDGRRSGFDRDGSGNRSGGSGTKVKITRFRRKGSLLNLSHAKSHFWARVCEGFKQVIPWRRRQENLRRTTSSAT